MEWLGFILVVPERSHSPPPKPFDKQEQFSCAPPPRDATDRITASRSTFFTCTRPSLFRLMCVLIVTMVTTIVLFLFFARLVELVELGRFNYNQSNMIEGY